MDLSNWDENEQACEEQQISIEPLHCEENNITSCSDNFTLSYLDEIITLSFQDTNSSVLAEKLNALQAFQGRGSINATSVAEGNATVFLVSFCFADPAGIEVLNGTVADSHALSLNTTRLVQGNSAKDFYLVFDQPDLASEALTPRSTKENIENALEGWFSKKCEVPSKGNDHIKSK